MLDTTRAQFLGQEPGALGSRSVLNLTAVSSREDGEVQLLPLGIAGNWEQLDEPRLPTPLEGAAAVLYSESTPPYRQRIYLLGGRTQAAQRLNTVYTCEVQPDGTLTDWVLQNATLPRGLADAAAALSTMDVFGDPITPTIYVIGGKYTGGESSAIYYAHIDPATLDITGWNTATVGLPAPRLGLSAVANRGYLYAIGGFASPSTYSSAVWHFSIDETGAPVGRSTDYSLPGAPTNNPNAAYHQTVLLSASPGYPTDTLYVIGGYNSVGSTQRVLRTDIYPPGSPDAGYLVGWEDVPEDDLPQPLSAFAAAVGNPQGAGRQVYLIGGAQGVGGNIPQDTIRSSMVDDERNAFYTWYGSVWLTSPALPAVRYRHAAVQAGEYIYAIAGHGSNDPVVYYNDILRGHLVGSGAWQHAPSGQFLSRVVDLGRKYRLMWFQWTTTITPTDPGVGIVLQFRAGNRPDLSDAADAWTDFFSSTHGLHTPHVVLVPHLSNIPFDPPIARYVQYRAILSTTEAYSNITPLLEEVGLRVENGPDLMVSGIQISCPECYGSFASISQTITIRFTVRNQGGAVPVGNDFYTALFITHTAGYSPTAPDRPEPPRFLPGSTYWSLQGTNFPPGAGQVLTTTVFFTEPQRLFLYFYADYHHSALPPDYLVGEADPNNNLTVFSLTLLNPGEIRRVYLPLVFRRGP
ncbi:MAG: hypothetical protein ACP5OO_03620 [Chloroflexia bacterium]